MEQLLAPQSQKFVSHFQRFEFKYHLSPLQADRIWTELASSHMRPDPVIADSPQPRYSVWSIYFDSPGLKCWRENESGERRRFKLRARTYRGSGQEETVFLEIKRKDDAVVTKDRLALPKALWQEAFLEEQDPFFLLGHPNVLGDRTVLEEFLWKQARYAMRPVCLVAYDRAPLVGRYNERFRVTVDQMIRASAIPSFDGHDAFLPVFRGRAVLEVKFNNKLPHWFHRILQRHELRRAKFSKYYNGVSVLKRYRLIP